jgi:hypothetical protein
MWAPSGLRSTGPRLWDSRCLSATLHQQQPIIVGVDLAPKLLHFRSDVNSDYYQESGFASGLRAAQKQSSTAGRRNSCSPHSPDSALQSACSSSAAQRPRYHRVRHRASEEECEDHVVARFAGTGTGPTTNVKYEVSRAAVWTRNLWNAQYLDNLPQSHTK